MFSAHQKTPSILSSPKYKDSKDIQPQPTHRLIHRNVHRTKHSRLSLAVRQEYMHCDCDPPPAARLVGERVGRLLELVVQLALEDGEVDDGLSSAKTKQTRKLSLQLGPERGLFISKFEKTAK